MDESKLEKLKELCPEAKDLSVAAENFNLMLDRLPEQPLELYIGFLREIDPQIGHHAIRVRVSLIRDMVKKYRVIADCILELGDRVEMLEAEYRRLWLAGERRQVK